jgi:thioredoxin-dependent peroxiredoxin
MKLLIPLFVMMTVQLSAQEKQAAIDFTATTIEGKTFTLSDLKGKKIFLTFYRNGACALCNLRVHEIALRQKEFDKAGIEIIAVFESSIEDMKPYVGKQKLGFTLLSDPGGKIYEQYGIKNSPEAIQAVMTNHSADQRVREADEAGFRLTKQEGSNFFRLPADVLIDRNFTVVTIHHCDELINHLPIDEVLKF